MYARATSPACTIVHGSLSREIRSLAKLLCCCALVFGIVLASSVLYRLLMGCLPAAPFLIHFQIVFCSKQVQLIIKDFFAFSLFQIPNIECVPTVIR